MQHNVQVTRRDGDLNKDELGSSISIYVRGCCAGPRPGRKASRSAARQAEAAGLLKKSFADVEDFLGLPDAAAQLATLAEAAVESLGVLNSQVRPVAQRLAEFVLSVAGLRAWSRNEVFAKLMVPALAAMRSPKTRAFGVMLASMKLLWRAEDWPDPDRNRSKSLSDFVEANLLSGPDILAGAWLISHLGLDRFFPLPGLFLRLCGNIQALRVYCVAAPPMVQVQVVQSAIARAGCTSGRERREWLATAADLIVRCKLDRREFPEVARQKAINWLCYIVHQLPLEKAEDYAYGDAELLALCIEQLAGTGNVGGAATLYHRHRASLDGHIRPATLRQVHGAEPTGERPDAFAPSEATAVALPLGERDVIWVDTVELVALAEAAVATAPVVGVDLEWGSLGDWLDPSLALLQLALPDRVFLVDLSMEELRNAIGSLLQRLLGGEQPLTLCFSFHNDMRELARSPWAAVCEGARGLCDLQLVATGMRGESEGLASLVKRTLHRPLCKAEQRSCWHRRPLRAAQRHYAALDAHVLLQVGAVLAGAPLEEPELLAARLQALPGPTAVDTHAAGAKASQRYPRGRNRQKHAVATAGLKQQAAANARAPRRKQCAKGSRKEQVS